jgi:anaerobic ribonucleoside-triphosphate reductase activating protein
MNYHSILNCDVANYIGCRVVLYISGCIHHCKGCQNPQTWDFNGGRLFDDVAKDYLFKSLDKSYIKGLTISGGDPLCSYDDVLELCKEVKKLFPNKDICIYSGFTLEELINNGKTEILDYIDVLIDGRFIEELKDLTLEFRGSSNQRILKKGVDF